VSRSGVVSRCFSVFGLGRLSLHAGTMPRVMRVEYPGAIYHVLDRGDRQEPSGQLRRSGLFISTSAQTQPS